MSERPYDLVLFGATGFTGGLTADYLAENAPEGLKWALAGRSTAKLGVSPRSTHGDRSAPRRPTAGRSRRDRRRFDRTARGLDQSRHHHGRPLRALRRAARRRLRKDRDRLRRPLRRARVRRRHLAQVRRRRPARAARVWSTVAASTRSRTTSARTSRFCNCPRASRSDSRASSRAALASRAAPSIPR